MPYTCATSYIIWPDEVFGLHSNEVVPTYTTTHTHTLVRAPTSRHGSSFWTIFSAGDPHSLFPTRGLQKKKSDKSGPFVSMPFTTASVRNESTTKSIFVVIVHDNVDDTKQRTDTDARRKNNPFIHVSSLNFCRRFGNTLRFLFFHLKGLPDHMWVSVSVGHMGRYSCGAIVVVDDDCSLCAVARIKMMKSERNIQSIDLNKLNGAPLSNHLSHSECLWQFVSKIRSQNPSAEMCFKCVNGTETWQNDGIIMIELDQ